MYGADYGMVSFGIILGSIVVYVITVVFTLWIGYLIMRTAVKNGILLADRERGRIN